MFSRIRRMLNHWRRLRLSSQMHGDLEEEPDEKEKTCSEKTGEYAIIRQGRMPQGFFSTGSRRVPRFGRDKEPMNML